MNIKRVHHFLLSQLLIVIGILGLSTQVYAQQDNSCTDVLQALAEGIDRETCQQVGEDTICYASESLVTDFRTPGLSFAAPNDRVNITDLRSLVTEVPTGSAIMYVQTSEGPVKIALFGSTNILPEGKSVFTMRKTGGQMLCEQTPSGMMVQTKQGKVGQVVVGTWDHCISPFFGGQ